MGSKSKFLSAIKTRIRKTPHKKERTVVAQPTPSLVAQNNPGQIRRGYTTTAGGTIHRIITDGATFSLNLHFTNAAHVSFLAKNSGAIPADRLAEILIRGNSHIPARPVFNDFVKQKNSDILKLVAKHLNFDKGTNTDALAEDIKKCFVDWVQQGNVRPPNETRYAKRKADLTGSDVPFLATGALLDALEVTSER